MVSDTLLVFSANNYEFDKSSLHFISESTNQIYSFQKEDKAVPKWYILRFSQRPIEQLQQTKAEMDWLYYLANNGINVSLPLPTKNNELVISTEEEEEEEGKTYIISAFEVLSGKFWDRNNPDLWNEKIFFNWGKVMGDIHKLTKEYVPADASCVRTAFTGHNALFLDNIKDCTIVYEIAKNLISEIMALPKDKDSYGLIHYDVHPWNFIIEDGKINVFDFDDSLYGWFALDIGIALYHGLWWGRNNDAGYDFTEEMIKSFIEGYLSANYLSDFWIAKIPMFMKYRQICRLSWFYDAKNIDANISELIYNIENNILFTGLTINSNLFNAEELL